MPAAAQASEAARLSEGRQVLAEARDGLVGRQRAVGEPRREARLLDERIGEASRIGRERKTAPTARDRDEPEAQTDARANASTVIRNGPSCATSPAVGSLFAAAKSMLKNARPIAAPARSGQRRVRDQPRGIPPSVSPAPAATAARTTGGSGRSVIASPTNQTNAIASLTPGSFGRGGCRAGRARGPRRDDHAAVSCSGRSRSSRPRSRRRASRYRRRSGVVGRGDEAGAVVEVLAEDLEQPFVAETVLPNVGSSRTRQPGRRTSTQASDRRRCSPPDESVWAADPERLERQPRAASINAGAAAVLPVEPEHDLLAHRSREELPLRLLEDVTGSASEVARGQRRGSRRPAGPRRGSAAGDRRAAGRGSTCRCRSDRRARPARRHPARGRSPRRPVTTSYPNRTPEPTATDRRTARPAAERGQLRVAVASPSSRGSQMPAAASAAGPIGTSSGVPTSIGAPSRSERKDEVGQRPGGVDAVLDEHDRGRSPSRGRPGVGRRRRLPHAGRGSRSARRARADLGPRRRAPRRARAAAAGRRRVGSPTALQTLETRLGEGLRTRARIASSGQPRFSRPNATSSSTRSMTSCEARILEHEADGRATGRAATRGVDAGGRSPATVAGSSRGISPATARREVLLPDPDGADDKQALRRRRRRSEPSTAGLLAPR